MVYAGRKISIHAPREGGDEYIYDDTVDTSISIHAPREGGDAPNAHRMPSAKSFQSTPPARGATSIHSPMSVQ